MSSRYPSRTLPIKISRTVWFGQQCLAINKAAYWPTWLWQKSWSAAGSVVRFQAFLLWFVWKCRRVLVLVVQIDRIKIQNLPLRNKTLAKMWLHQLRRDRTFYDKTLKNVYVCNEHFIEDCYNYRYEMLGASSCASSQVPGTPQFKPSKILVCSDSRNPFVSPPRSKIKIQTVDVKK